MKKLPQDHRRRRRPSISPVSSVESLSDIHKVRAKHSTRTRPNACISPRISKKALTDNGDCSDTDSYKEDHDYTTDFTTLSSTLASEAGKPDEYECDGIESFRDREYPQLWGKVYLDHGGSTLYAKSLIEEFSADLVGNLYGNPHSASSPSHLSGHRIDTIREKTLLFFHADPEEWDLVFTANATAAIKLVIECFRDNASSTNTPVWYGYHKDAHTSLVGIREMTKMYRCFTSDEEVDIWIQSGGLGGPRPREMGLFAFPGQSNMTGRRLPLSWCGRIRKQLHKAKTYTLLDAAALATTANLDLSDVANAPDFVALSFYKIFGFPNIGALLVRKDSAHALEKRRYFGGGTVDMIISVNDAWHAMKDGPLHERLEDGTLPFHSIFALDHAINVHERLYGTDPMKFISQHTAQLGKRLYDELTGLHHGNGVPAVVIYKDDHAIYGDPTVQGATIAFNVQKPDGTFVGYSEVEEAADQRSIFVRSGSLCNPGGMATYLNWSPAEMRAAYDDGHRCSRPTQVMHGKPTGVVRVSLGAMSTMSDIQALTRFLRETYVDSKTSCPPPQSTTVTGPHPAMLQAMHKSPATTTTVPSNLMIPPPSPSYFMSRPQTPSNSAHTHENTPRFNECATALPSAPFDSSKTVTSRSTPSKLRKNVIPGTPTGSQSFRLDPKSPSDSDFTRPKMMTQSQSQSQLTPKPSKSRFGRSMVTLLHRKPASQDLRHAG